MRVAAAWSSQNPGAPIASSSSPRRCVSRSGSKVITDPGELGPDLLQALVERLAVGLGHESRVSASGAGHHGATDDARSAMWLRTSRHAASQASPKHQPATSVLV